MNAPGATQTLTAKCVQCGADVPLALAGPFPTCRHCGNAQPLAPAVAAKVAAMRGRLEGRAAQERQMTGRLVSGATSFHGLTIMIMVTSWLFFGGWALLFALSGDVSFGSFAFRAVEDVDLAGRWWVMLGAAIGLPTSVAALGLVTFWLRGLAHGALPLAPTYPGANPRCRCCGAELPGGTALRRCRFCGSDSLVLGEHYQRAEGELDRALSATAERFGKSLATRIRRAETVLWAGSLVPVALLLVGLPIGLVTGVTLPELWIVPGVLTLLAIGAVLLPLGRRLPAVEPLECLAVGSQLVIDGHPNVVGAELLVGAQGGTPAVLQAVGSDARTPELLLQVTASPKGPKTRLWELRQGGQPLDADASRRLAPAYLTRQLGEHPSSVEQREAQALWEGRALRVWDAASPAVGSAPLWTATQRSKSAMVHTT